MALAAGSIAFAGFNADGTDNIAFVALADISVGETIIFEDNEWNGTAFVDTNEGAFSWTATVSVTAGTVVRIDNIGSGTITANVGTATSPVAGRGSNRGVSGDNEVIYAYQGTATAPTFITAIANSGFSATTGLLTGTGLTAGTNAIDLSTVDTGADIASYNGLRTGQSNFSAYGTLINNPNNWVTQNASGDQGADGTAPDLPFDATAFTLNAVSTNPTVNLAVSSSSGTESGTTAITVTATASAAVTGNQTVALSVAGAGITAGDYYLTGSTITIPTAPNSIQGVQKGARLKALPLLFVT